VGKKFLEHADGEFLFSPTLAKLIGLEEAIMTQLLHLNLIKKGIKREDKTWFNISYEQWERVVPCTSRVTIKRKIQKLSKDNIIITKQFHDYNSNNANWYSINYTKLRELTNGKSNLLSDSVASGYISRGMNHSDAQERERLFWDYFDSILTMNQGNKRHTFTNKEKSIVWTKTGGKCFYCQRELNPFEDFTVDHVIPISKGGQEVINNYVPSCRSCNSKKGNRNIKGCEF
jgi:hypothetical protein